MHKKIFNTPSFGGEVKPSVLCRRFAACKRSLNLCASRDLGKNYYRISFAPTVPPFAARISCVVADGGTWRLKWERLRAGESNGKLPPRTCPGCSVPEPYRSYDWALVPAKPGLQGWILMNERIYIYIYSIQYKHCPDRRLFSADSDHAHITNKQLRNNET